MSGYSHDGLIKQFWSTSNTPRKTRSGRPITSVLTGTSRRCVLRTAISKCRAYSHEGLVEQLEYEGYTASQAEYGVAGAGL